MKTGMFNNFSDSIPLGHIIGGVAIYPQDDYSHNAETTKTSRDIVDRYIKTIRGESLQDALIRAIARRLTAATGGETAQNIDMLDMLRKLVNGEPIRETDPLACDYIRNPLTGNIL